MHFVQPQKFHVFDLPDECILMQAGLLHAHRKDMLQSTEPTQKIKQSACDGNKSSHKGCSSPSVETRVRSRGPSTASMAEQTGKPPSACSVQPCQFDTSLFPRRQGGILEVADDLGNMISWCLTV